MLKKQAEDIDTMLQYMSRQFIEMQTSYKEELAEIETSFLQVTPRVLSTCQIVVQ